MGYGFGVQLPVVIGAVHNPETPEEVTAQGSQYDGKDKRTETS
jgi:hypothetical protein